MMIAELVFYLCALTSLACALLLVRSYRRTRAKLLFWSAVCFAGLALNNVTLVIDKVVIPELDLSIVRSVPALAGLLALLYGFITERL